MKIPFLVLLGCFLLCTRSARADSYAHKEPFSQTHAFSTTGTLQLDNVNGPVEIRAWDRNEILVEGEKSAASEDELHRIELKIELSDSDARVKVHLPKRSGWASGGSIRASVSFRVSVPAGTQLENVSCVNSPIHVEGVRGRANLKSVNGGIEARGLASDARLHTVNGRILAEFPQIVAGQSLTFESVNGAVEVRVPRDAGLAVNCSVVNGHIDSDLPITLQGRHHGRSLSGTIGDGRASLHASTVNGGIRLTAK